MKIYIKPKFKVGDYAIDNSSFETRSATIKEVVLRGGFFYYVDDLGDEIEEDDLHWDYL